MSDGFFKKTGQKAQGLARKAAQNVYEEQKEYVKSAKVQLGVEPQTQAPEGPSVVDEIITGPGVTKSVPEDVHEGIHKQERKRMNELQEELKEAHQQELAKIQEWRKSQEQALQPPIEDKPETFAEPTPKRKMGMLSGMAQKAKGGLELMRGKK